MKEKRIDCHWKEKCIDCHWFDKLYDSADDGYCRVEPPAIGQPEVQQDGRCGKFRLKPGATDSEKAILKKLR